MTNAIKSVLIAGATGLVGKSLAIALLNKGYKVKVLSRNVHSAQKLLPNAVTVLKWPTENEKLLLSSCNQCDAFINLTGANIGAKRWTPRYKNEILKSRLNAIDQLAAIIHLMPEPPKVWIQASAVGYYGPKVKGKTDESGAAGSGFLASVTQQMEQKINNLQIQGMRKTILRLGVVMSDEGGFLAQMKKAFNFGVGIYPDNGTNRIAWIHQLDLNQLIIECLQNNQLHGVINAVAPNSITWYRFAQLVKKKSNALLLLPVPHLFFKVLLGTEKAKNIIITDQEIVPKKLINAGFTYQCKSLDCFME